MKPKKYNVYEENKKRKEIEYRKNLLIVLDGIRDLIYAGGNPGDKAVEQMRKKDKEWKQSDTYKHLKKSVEESEE